MFPLLIREVHRHLRLYVSRKRKKFTEIGNYGVLFEKGHGSYENRKKRKSFWAEGSRDVDDNRSPDRT